jgi:hypothetical protein
MSSFGSEAAQTAATRFALSADKSQQLARQFRFVTSGTTVDAGHLEALQARLVPSERDAFTLSLRDLDWDPYLESSLFGLAKHVLNGRLIDVTRPSSRSRTRFLKRAIGHEPEDYAKYPSSHRRFYDYKWARSNMDRSVAFPSITQHHTAPHSITQHRDGIKQKLP